MTASDVGLLQAGTQSQAGPPRQSKPQNRSRPSSPTSSVTSAPQSLLPRRLEFHYMQQQPFRPKDHDPPTYLSMSYKQSPQPDLYLVQHPRTPQLRRLKHQTQTPDTLQAIAQLGVEEDTWSNCGPAKTAPTQLFLDEELEARFIERMDTPHFSELLPGEVTRVATELETAINDAVPTTSEDGVKHHV